MAATGDPATRCPTSSPGAGGNCPVVLSRWGRCPAVLGPAPLPGPGGPQGLFATGVACWRLAPAQPPRSLCLRVAGASAPLRAARPGPAARGNGAGGGRGGDGRRRRAAVPRAGGNQLGERHQRDRQKRLAATGGPLGDPLARCRCSGPQGDGAAGSPAGGAGLRAAAGGTSSAAAPGLGSGRCRLERR